MSSKANEILSTLIQFGLLVQSGNGGYSASAFGADSHLLTVGKGGRFKKIQDALDYIATQPAFIPLTLPSPGTVSSWPQYSSKIQFSLMPSQAANNFIPDETWVKMSGDTYYYPYQQVIGSISGTALNAEQSMHTAMLRLDATVSSGNLTWWKENRFTVFLLDNEYEADGVLPVMKFEANMCVRFASAGLSRVSGKWSSTAAVRSGRVEFTNVMLSNGSAASGIFTGFAGGTVNTVKLITTGVKYASTWPDLFSPFCSVGSFTGYDFELVQNPTTQEGHLLNFNCPGDVRIAEMKWIINTNGDIGAYGKPNAWLIDRVGCRNTYIQGVKAILNDPAGCIGNVAICGNQGADINPWGATKHVYIGDCEIVSFDTLGVTYPPLGAAASNLSILELGTDMDALKFTLKGNSIIAPNGSRNLKLVRAAANPLAPVAINIGPNNGGLTYDAQANITYTVL